MTGHPSRDSHLHLAAATHDEQSFLQRALGGDDKALALVGVRYSRHGLRCIQQMPDENLVLAAVTPRPLNPFVGFNHQVPITLSTDQLHTIGV